MEKLQREIKAGRPYKMTEEQIDEMVRRFNSGESMRKIAESFGIGAPTVSRYIKSRAEVPDSE